MKTAKPKAAYFVYMLECADGTYYTGSTNDVEKRVTAHNAAKSRTKYTRSRLPVQLIYTEQCANKSTAMKREAAIKRMEHFEKSALMDTTAHNRRTG